MKDDNNWLMNGVNYAKKIEGQENLSPNELRIIALAREVESLRRQLRGAQIQRPK